MADEDKMKTISLTISKEGLEIIDRAADKKRQSRSGYMEIATLEKAKQDLSEN